MLENGFLDGGRCGALRLYIINNYSSYQKLLLVNPTLHCHTMPCISLSLTCLVKLFTRISSTSESFSSSMNDIICGQNHILS